MFGSRQSLNSIRLAESVAGLRSTKGSCNRPDLHFIVTDGVKEYFLNSDQALLCLMQANTRKAADLRVDLVEMMCDRKRPAHLLSLWQKLFGRCRAAA